LRIWNRKIITKIKKGVDILIFDEVNSEYIQEILGQVYTSEILYVRPKPIYLNLNFFLFFCKSFLSILISIDHKSIKSTINKAYTKSTLLIYKSKAVITMIDNNIDFHWASKNINGLHFIAIQNGFRLAYVTSNKFFLNHYFCFGQHEIDTLPKQGHKINKFYPCGSLIADTNLAKHRDVSIKYDILIISCWRGNIGYTKEVRDTMMSMKKMDLLIAKYLSERKNMKAAIILRSEKNSEHWFIPELKMDEETYYKNIYKDSAIIVQNDFKNKNIYKLILQSNLLISTLSTALIEGFGIGKKILLCNFTGVEDYHIDFPPEITTKIDDFSSFSKLLDKIFSIPNSEYSEFYNKLQTYYMNFDPVKPVKECISEKIKEILI
jgi:surface carbohydrate biosynthesis protein